MSERIYLSPPHMGGSELDYIKKAFDSNFIAPVGPQLAEFEARFSELTGIKHCVALSSGTAAIHLALHCVGICPGDMVIASSLTFIGSVSPVTFLGGSLMFVDSDPQTWTMDVERLKQILEINHRVGRHVAAVVPTDLFGQCANYDAILEACAPYGIPVIGDCAESLGASYKGRAAGKGLWASAFSFNGNKIITTSGGGMLASDDGTLIERVRWLSQQARDDAPHYEHSEIGYNYRMSNIVAAIGLGQLDVLEERVERTREIFDWYQNTLGDLPGVSFMPEAEYGTHSRWLTVALIDRDMFGVGPEEIRQALEKENIESRPVWKPMHLQPVFRTQAMVGGEVCEHLFKQGLCLPSGTNLTEDDLTRIAETIRSCQR